MKRVLLSIVFIVCFSTGVSAESSVWKAQNGNATIYLGGTFHLLREADYPLPPEFETAYRASDVVVFETDIGKAEEPSMQQILLKKALYADGSTVDKHLSASAYGKLKAYCDANGIPLSALKQFKPSMLMVTLAIMELMKLGVTQQGVDKHFYLQANRDGKAVEELETAEEQINYVVSMADGYEDEFVVYSIRDMETMKQQFESFVTAWRTGDNEKLDELLVAELKSRWPKLYQKLFTDRNRNWLSMIDSYQKTPQTEFVLVGVGHLVGPDGLIEALRKKGYTVKKL